MIASDKKKIIGENIKKFREALRLKQDELAEYLGVAREMISYYENGKRTISVAELNKLAHLFGIDFADLLETDQEQQNLNLAFTFRNANSTNDRKQIANFKKVVMNYLKMQSIK